MAQTLKDIFNTFLTEGTFREAEPFGSGHIHETYLVKTAEPEADDYILQKINNTVFLNIPELQENLERVTGHLFNKISAIPGSDTKRECLRMMCNKSGKSWFTDDKGDNWRIFIFIKEHRSFDIVDSPGKAYEGGRAIGRFQALLADLPGPRLHETIPSFHDLEKRINNFNNSLKKDPVSRRNEVLRECNFLIERAGRMKIISELGKASKIPVRITHNDTKFNNILFDKKGRSLCIIDLDTVMPGYFHSDFGDAIRTGANTAAEDENDLSQIKMDITLFEAYAQGYLSETRDKLNSTEKEYLALSPLVMTYEQSVRFLTDYIDGDIYYKIHHKQHNLRRTRAQIRLLEDMEEKYGRMKDIINKLI